MSNIKNIKSNVSYNTYCANEKGDAISFLIKRGDIFTVIHEQRDGYKIQSSCNKEFSISMTQVVHKMFEHV
jgi:hypothetical protein